MPSIASEIQIAERFAVWLSKTTGEVHKVIRGPNPPDFLMTPETWLELSDIYANDKQATFLNSRKEKTFSIDGGSPDDPALRLWQQLDEKLAKTSYRKIYQQRGKGILLLTCQVIFFDQVELSRVREALSSFKATNDQGLFRRAYFEYQLQDADRVYDIIYPKAV